jgi:hypothetical protein
MKHLLGISGGKDSAALAIYMARNYPNLEIEYYTCDTGKELQETYDLIERLESVLGKRISRYDNYDHEQSTESNPFDHFLNAYGHYLPSATARWCTKKMKLEPFEKHVSDEPTISYVGIRGDENREGYISKRQNIQTIFPFRRNIWSGDVIDLVLSDYNSSKFLEVYMKYCALEEEVICVQVINEPISLTNTTRQKADRLLDFGVSRFNRVVHELLRDTDYPIGRLDDFPLIENEDNLGIQDIYNILNDSGVGIPAYYLPIEFEVEHDGEIRRGQYSRSRSGCFFCFYQQKIEWVWLLEQHPKLFAEAMNYEKDGFTWSEEPLVDLCVPERVKQIKLDYIRKQESARSKFGTSWKDELLKQEGLSCPSCFI